MLLFDQCLSHDFDYKLFWKSENANLPKCLRYYGFDVLPYIGFVLILLIDYSVNRSLKIKNGYRSYFKIYPIRCFFHFSLLFATGFFDLFNLIDQKNLPSDQEFTDLIIFSMSLKSIVYCFLFTFDILHFIKNFSESSLLSLIVTIDWFLKTYLLFEITYLNPTSYQTVDSIQIIIQTISLSFLFISYVFLPNYVLDEIPNSVRSEQVSPSTRFLENKSIFSQIIFGYFEAFVFCGSQHKYNVDNILPLQKELTVNSVLSDYEKNYKEKYLKSSKFENKYNIIYLILNLYRNFLLFNLFIFLIQTILSQLDPQILYKLVEFIKKPNDLEWHGYFFTVLLLISQLSRVIITGIFNRNMNYLQAKVQILLVNHIYKKSLKRSMLKDNESYDLYNLMTVDVNNVINACYYCFDVVSIPINVILSIYSIYRLMGISIFYALLVFAPIVVPFTWFITQKTKQAQKQTMKAKDLRLKVLNDLLNGIRSVKLNYWDPIFNKKISVIREEEVKHFKKYQILYGFSDISYQVFPMILSMLTFIFYLCIDEKNVLTPELAFTALNYFALLKASFVIVPRCFHLIVTSFVSGKRIQNFLKSNEKEDYVTREFDEKYAIEIEKEVSFSWEDFKDEQIDDHTLKNLNIKIKKDSLVALVSKNVASGRSSFLSCLLGEMRMVNRNTNQKVNISKDMQIALVGSKPWIIEKKSIKENILFGTEFNQQKYDYVLDQCLIREEFIKFVNKDNQIMNKDTSYELKQKVSLARAYYSEANLLLLDDFLNQFNDYSAKIIFDKIINPTKNCLFKNKTCIMVLNRLEYLKYFDQILTFNNGQVTLDCDFREYQKLNNLSNNAEEHHQVNPDELYKQSINYKLHNYKNLDFQLDTNDNHDEKNCSNCSKKLIDDNEEKSRLGCFIYKFYLSTWKWWCLFLMLFGYFISMVFQIVQSNSLAKWTNNTDSQNENNLKSYNQDGLIKYALWTLLISLFYGIAVISAVYGEVNSAIKFHKLLLKKVLSLPLFFFDRTPIGSIVNRFSKDMDTVDCVVPFFFKLIVYVAFQIISVFFVIIMSFPLSIILIAFMMIIYCFIFKIFLKTLITVKRLELQTRTQLYICFEELSSGLPVILAYNKTKLFTQNLNRKLETNVNCSFMIYIAFKWLALRNEFISIVILIGTALFSILNIDEIDGSQVALVLYFALQLVALLMALMGLWAEFFTQFVSIDRICEYLNLEEEEEDLQENSPPPENWPTNGAIKFDNFSSTYIECRKAVLNNLNLEIAPGSLVTVVDGKSENGTSLALSLLNVNKSINGRVLIDNIDLAKISIKELRMRLSIITQESALFIGTISFNLDPEGLYEDSELWTILEYVGLKDQILCLPGNLNYVLNNCGSNLSLSQRRLLCLGRCMLRNSKIMIIDETDCNFDLDTDLKLRKLYRTVFKDKTVLLITKNVENIMISDKVLFLHDGYVRNYDEPSKIFAQEDVLNNNLPDILDILNNN